MKKIKVSFFIICLDRLDTDSVGDHAGNPYWGDYDNFCSFIKESIFNQADYLKVKLKSLNSYTNKI